MYDLPVPEPKTLRHFGLMMGGMIAALFGLLLPWLWGGHWPWWPWIVASFLSLFAFLKPMALQGVYRWWMLLGSMLGALNTRFILSLIFYMIITPLGLGMRLVGKDPLQRKRDSQTSYRVPSEVTSGKDMENPF
jgi:hypothetical protein